MKQKHTKYRDEARKGKNGRDRREGAAHPQKFVKVGAYASQHAAILPAKLHS